MNVLNKNNINYIIYNEHNFDKKNYDNKPEFFIINNFKNNNILNFTLYEYQIEALNNIEKYLKKNNICKIIWACGLGKALLGILTAIRINSNLTLIGVPNINLQKQMYNEIINICGNIPILLINSNNYLSCDIHKINEFININNNKFIITTYTSCHYLSNKFFDLKIGDEAHHLVGNELEKTKNYFHKIKSCKTLFMTATEKIIDNNKSKNIIYSMDDKNIFGECIDNKSINWAIKNKKITDYNIIIIKNTELEIFNIIKKLSILDKKIYDNKFLLLSAYISLKSIETFNDLTHIIIYTNKTENAELVKEFIDIILKYNIININKENYYNNALHSNIKININDEINNFYKSSWGIISCVYIFGEGFNCPKLNGVVFSENMESDIRIVQSSLRPNRLDINNPNKKAYIIIPYIETDNISFEKCRKIISKMRNVDETIEQKINVFTLSNNLYNNTKEYNNDYEYLIVNENELTNIMIKLKYTKSLLSSYSDEEDEYKYIQSLNKQLKINNKDEYYSDKIKKNHIMYIYDPPEYFTKKGVWTNWYNFLGIDTTNFIQSKNDWEDFCKKNNVKTLDDYNNLCNINKQLPKYPNEFYNNFTNIIFELNLNIKRRR